MCEKLDYLFYYFFLFYYFKEKKMSHKIKTEVWTANKIMSFQFSFQYLLVFELYGMCIGFPFCLYTARVTAWMTDEADVYCL